MKLADTSIIVAAAQSWNPAHEIARKALTGCRRAISHTLLETYSVLTRSPSPFRIDAETAHTWLTAQFVGEVSLPVNSHLETLSRLHGLGITGGAIYDGIIALTASSHRATLLTLDKRASTTYVKCGVKFQLLSA
ncbi:MAG: PIN domain-containing protein [Acidobacteria bacterium]|nr:PIN domain-containing protein [Acidobacteriota bacterium]